MQRTLLAFAAVSLPLALNAQTWTESSDAGELPGTAEIIAGSGPLTQIDGVLSGNGDTDVFAIRVIDPTIFTATTQGTTTAFSDTALWLFDCNGRGISFNDDTPGGTNLLSTITGQFLPPGPGVYLLAINSYSNDAENSNNLEIWNDTPFNVERQPDGPGAGRRILDHWNGSGFSAGAYQVLLTGAEFVGILDESGDAGELIGTAQPAVGCGALTEIFGSLSTAGDTDMFMIRIPDPTTFAATTEGTTAMSDTALWLFDCTGNALSFNDDTQGGTNLLSTVTGQFLPPGPGIYMLAINSYTNDAENSSNDEIWNDAPYNVERQPDGPGASNPVLDHWNGAGFYAGAYEIHLTGAEFLGAGAATCVSVGSGCGGLDLTCNTLPRRSSNFTFTLSGSAGLSTCLVKFGQASPGIPLPPPVMAGCFGYMGTAPTLQLPLQTGSTATYSVSIPGNPGFVNIPLAVQGVALDANTSIFTMSNALNALVGDC